MAKTRRGKPVSARSARARSARPASEEGSNQVAARGEPELVVILKPDAVLEAAPSARRAGRGPAGLATVLRDTGVTLQPMFGVDERRLRVELSAVAAAALADVPDLTRFYRVDAPAARVDEIAAALSAQPEVEAAYVKPPAEPAAYLNTMIPAAEDAPPVTPDFTARQGYLDAATTGIDARFAWTQAGGSGAGVRIIDIEGAWRFSHEDLLQNQGGVVGGTQSSDLGWRNHGTAVVGEFGADRNGIGVTGICPDANVRAISIFGGTGSAGAIRQAANALGAGDVILIELHRPGPRHNFASRNDQLGYIAIEWWPDDFAAIQFAVARGVIVVEAAGNGAENLDDAIYGTRPPGFPSTWTNPFNRSNRDSGAVIVGAGAPPPGTHGRDHGPDRSRLDFSNYGASVDAQGWGREVTTTGYGDLQGGTSEDLWYTDRFSGTSSASPIVVGAIGCLQGIVRARGLTPLTPARVRQLLRATGSPQQDAPARPRTQRIGSRPNLRQLVQAAIGKSGKEISKEKEGKEVVKEGVKELKDRKETAKEIRKEAIKEFKELKEKDFKERVKEFKEKDKDIFEGGGGFDRFGSASPGSLEERLAALEEQVSTLVHFISPELRPDLSTSALSHEESDMLALSHQLERQAADAKRAKDNKDVEKMREG